MSDQTHNIETLRQKRKMNKLSETMSQVHDYFKSEFDTLYELSDGSFGKRGLSLSGYLRTAQDLAHHLTMHHKFEERHLFPILAKKMPQFSEASNGDHTVSHRKIHDGLDALEKLVGKWTKQPSEYSPAELRSCLDGFRKVLFSHLDQEVADLRGENLKKYFTLEEVERFSTF